MESVEKGPETLVKITKVEPNREQPRKNFDEDALLELAESIKQFGLLQPILVQDRKDYYEIIAGERRWRASKMAGLKELPVVIKNMDKEETMVSALVENIQREGLNPIEEANGYKMLINDCKLKQDEVAERVGKSRTTITNTMRLLKLDERVQQMIIDEMISMGHARAILGIEDKEKQYDLATKAFDEKLSVREVEKLVKSMNQNKPKKPEKKENLDFIYKDIEERMASVLGTKIHIKNSKNKGKIEIDYFSNEELDRLTELIMSIKK